MSITFKLSNFPTTPLPNHPDLASLAGTVLGDYFAGRSLFRFNLSGIPISAIITSARLSLFANPTPSNNPHDGENESYLRRVMTPWSATTVAFDSQPDFSYINQVELPESISPTQDYPNIDVLTLVNQMISDPGHNYGFYLALRLEGIYRSMNFASSECTDILKRPLLVITYDTPLPVELSSFTSAINIRNVTLNWTTSMEENNSGFQIERSSTGNSDWSVVGFIKGNGNSKVQHSYSYEDLKLNSGKYKYRLKQLDFNGNFKYYNLSNDVEIGAPQKISLSQNYPNPFNPTTKILYDIPQDGMVSLRIYDESGRETKTIINEVKSAGYFSISFDGTNLSSGIYFYKLEFSPSNGIGNSLTESRKMILIK